MDQDAIIVEELEKSYGSVKALCGVDFSARTGTVLGLLGPNGAGKTTAVRILATLLQPDGGTARVAGLDVVKEAAALRAKIGLAGQYAAVDENLTGFENLEMVGRLYHLRRQEARTRANELLERFDLVDAAKRPAKTYSGGMRRRLDLAVSLVATPPVLFLDEPTTGLDPRSRVELWEVLRALVREGTTLLLTTQYLEEADHLADRIVVVDHGRIIAEGTALELKDQSGQASIVLTVSKAQDLRVAEEMLRQHVPTVHVDEAARQLMAPAEGLRDMTRIAAVFEHSEIELDDLGLKRPSLDDVFLHLTGHRAEDLTTQTTKEEQTS